MNNQEPFYTLKGYSLLEHANVTASMEDYLEMICRLSRQGEQIRIKDLSVCLHVRPSSASKMVTNLKDQGLVSFERYGTITLTASGTELGEYLLLRHKILHQFFCMINQNEDELEQVEKVEHFMTPKTIWNLKRWMDTHDGAETQAPHNSQLPDSHSK